MNFCLPVSPMNFFPVQIAPTPDQAKRVACDFRRVAHQSNKRYQKDGLHSLHEGSSLTQQQQAPPWA